MGENHQNPADSLALPNSLEERAEYQQVNREFQEVLDAKKTYRNRDLALGVRLINGVIGRGNHSVVYKGELRRSKLPLAVKRDERDFAAEYPALDRKIDSLERLNHPYVPKLIEFIPDSETGHTFFIMEYVHGQSLEQAVYQNGRFSQGRVLNWGCQILDAVAYLHAKGHIHGNISAENIILTTLPEKNGREEIRLIDFRLNAAGPAGEPETPAPPGTSMLISPPGIQDIFGRPVSAEDFHRDTLRDIYCVGAVLFRMLTGEVPRKDDSPEEKLRRLTGCGVSPDVCAIIGQAVEQDCARRYQSAEDMLSALRSLPRPRQKAVRRWGIAAFLIPLLALFVGFGLYTLGNRQMGRAYRMDRFAQDALDAQTTADYSTAADNTLKAAEHQPFDPPFTLKVRAALAEVSGAYDFIPGYKPLHSNAVLRGDPVRMCLSPDGTQIAVLVQNRRVGKSLIHIFDTLTGNELAALAADGTLTDFVFRDDGVLIYAGEDTLMGYDVAEGKVVWRSLLILDGSDSETPPLSPVSLALSTDGTMAAAMYDDEEYVYLYRTDGVRINGMLSYSLIRLPRETPGVPVQTETQEVWQASDRLLAFDSSGTHLAVSFSDGSLYVYRAANPDNYAVLLPPSDYHHFEGGFYDAPDGVSYFIYAACNLTETGIAASVRLSATAGEPLCRLFRTDRLDSRAEGENPHNHASDYDLNFPLYDAAHLLIDRTGIYLYAANRVYHVLPEKNAWGPYAETNGNVLLMRHTPGRLLVITQNDILVLYEENGELLEDALRRDLMNGTAFRTACISEDYLVLAVRDMQKLSVLRWEEPGTGQAAAYPPDAHHDSARLHSDGESVMLFDESGFFIYDRDGKLISAEMFEDWEQILYQLYLRSDRPEAECLKVVYANRTEYFSAKTGKPLDAVPASDTVDDDCAVYRTRNYRIEYRRGDGVSVYRKNADAPVASYPDQLLYASEYDGTLLLSFLSAGTERYGLLIDRQGNQLARLSGDCEIRPDGTLFADNGRGSLMESRLWTPDELREFVRNRGKGTG